jgi:hypothetical protein
VLEKLNQQTLNCTVFVVVAVVVAATIIIIAIIIAIITKQGYLHSTGLASYGDHP